VSGPSQKKKPAELLKANSTANPVSEKYIPDKKAEKKAGKVISSLVRNAKMTSAEAKAAFQVQDEPKLERARRSSHNYAAMVGVNFRDQKILSSNEYNNIY
jgi:hypothetical protein